MNTIMVRPRVLDESLAELLERLGLVSFIHHPPPPVRTSLTEDYYKGDNFPVDSYGFHSVTISYTEIFPAYHPAPADEIVMVWDSVQPVKPLYFLFSLHLKDDYLERLESKLLKEDDFVAFQVVPNDPKYGGFRIRSHAIHCEFTRGERDEVPFPSFFVLEPEPLPVVHPNEALHGVYFQVNFSD